MTTLCPRLISWPISHLNAYLRDSPWVGSRLGRSTPLSGSRNTRSHSAVASKALWNQSARGQVTRFFPWQTPFDPYTAPGSNGTPRGSRDTGPLALFAEHRLTDQFQRHA